MATLKNKYGSKWNKRKDKSIIPTRCTMNTLVRQTVNSRCEFRPTEFIIHRKIDLDIAVVF